MSGNNQEKGSVLIETALLIPILLMTLQGFMLYTRLLNDGVVAVNAARTGARHSAHLTGSLDATAYTAAQNNSGNTYTVSAIDSNTSLISGLSAIESKCLAEMVEYLKSRKEPLDQWRVNCQFIARVKNGFDFHTIRAVARKNPDSVLSLLPFGIPGVTFQRGFADFLTEQRIP